MITFADLGSYGRLGNQLFQYAALRAIGLEKGYEVKIPPPSNSSWHGQDCLLDNFSLECGFLEPADYESIKYLYVELDANKYDGRVYDIPDYTNLVGFFQSTLYFKKYESQIRNEFRLKEEISRECKEIISKLKKDHKCEIVSLHMRRGDHTDGTNPNTVNFYGTNNTFLKTSIYGAYLENAKKHFKNKKVKFLIFSGGTRKGDINQAEIEWCKQNFKDDIFLYSEGNNTIEDFGLIKECDHNITCHSTSFGWWAAFLNDNPEKIVTAPQYYFVDDRRLIREAFFPQGWHLV